jgi:hypothetical protein
VGGELPHFGIQVLNPQAQHLQEPQPSSVTQYDCSVRIEKCLTRITSRIWSKSLCFGLGITDATIGIAIAGSPCANLCNLINYPREVITINKLKST